MRGKTEEFLFYSEITKTERRNRKLARKKLQFKAIDTLSEETQEIPVESPIMAANNDEENPLIDTILNLAFNRPNSSIIQPVIGNNNWELKSSTIQLVERAQFGRGENEDPHRFIDRFLMVYDSTKHPQVSNDAIRLRLFPFAVKGKALSWLERQPARSIPTWDDLSQKFFAEFFSMERYNQMVNDITNFTQLEGETMCAAWNIFKDLMRRCPHYNLTTGNQVRIFFNGCTPDIRMVLNGAAIGTIKSLRENETLELIERMTANENEGLTSKHKRGILQLEGNDVMLAENKLLSQQMANLTSKLDKMQISGVQAKAATVVNGIWYDQRSPMQNVQRNQNFSVRGSNFQRRIQGTSLDFKSNNYLQSPPIQPKEPSDLEKANTKNTNASIRNLENQIGQLAKQIVDRTPGTFPGNTITNPKEDCMAITIRSGKVVVAPEKPNIDVEDGEKLNEVEESEKGVEIPSKVVKLLKKGEEKEQPIVVEKKKFELSDEYLQKMAPYPGRFKSELKKQQKRRNKVSIK
ncbi:uncharacterized protein LOC133284687 [Gastrolobium bilobum]|uniref:uncharacterized protein LOC133284687 n=1 Tax=Gastrolobium bilobum TaxID=150636 RepID=UPI002AB314EA|nr:uncharacterized protein LOC133284687 [Gastrolobium bilobum]